MSGLRPDGAAAGSAESAEPAVDQVAISVLAESAKPEPEPDPAESAVDDKTLQKLSDQPEPEKKDEDKSGLRNDILDDLTS